MKIVVFDSSALLRYFYRQKGIDEVTEWLAQIALNDAQGMISTVNLSEFFFIILRDQGMKSLKSAEKRFHYLNVQLPSQNHDLAMEAAKARQQFNLGTTDSFAAALTYLNKGILLTGDNDFAPLKNYIRIQFI